MFIACDTSLMIPSENIIISIIDFPELGMAPYNCSINFLGSIHVKEYQKERKYPYPGNNEKGLSLWQKTQ